MCSNKKLPTRYSYSQDALCTIIGKHTQRSNTRHPTVIQTTGGKYEANNLSGLHNMDLRTER